MRLSRELLVSRVKHLKSVQILKLQKAEIDTVDRLELCPATHTIILNHNLLTDCRGFHELPDLWKLDLAYNKIESLDGLSSIPIVGFLDLSYNKIEFCELRKLQNLRVLNLRLRGNEEMCRHPLYREFVISQIPGAICLDDFYVSAEERRRCVDTLREIVPTMFPSFVPLVPEPGADPPTEPFRDVDNPAPRGQHANGTLFRLRQPPHSRTSDREYLALLLEEYVFHSRREGRPVLTMPRGSARGREPVRTQGKPAGSNTLIQYFDSLAPVTNTHLLAVLACSLYIGMHYDTVRALLHSVGRLNSQSPIPRQLLALPPYIKAALVSHYVDVISAERNKGKINEWEVPEGVYVFMRNCVVGWRRAFPSDAPAVLGSAPPVSGARAPPHPEVLPVLPTRQTYQTEAEGRSGLANDQADACAFLFSLTASLRHIPRLQRKVRYDLLMMRDLLDEAGYSFPAAKDVDLAEEIAEGTRARAPTKLAPGDSAANTPKHPPRTLVRHRRGSAPPASTAAGGRASSAEHGYGPSPMPLLAPAEEEENHLAVRPVSQGGGGGSRPQTAGSIGGVGRTAASTLPRGAVIGDIVRMPNGARAQVIQSYLRFVRVAEVDRGAVAAAEAGQETSVVVPMEDMFFDPATREWAMDTARARGGYGSRPGTVGSGYASSQGGRKRAASPIQVMIDNNRYNPGFVVQSEAQAVDLFRRTGQQWDTVEYAPFNVMDAQTMKIWPRAGNTRSTQQSAVDHLLETQWRMDMTQRVTRRHTLYEEAKAKERAEKEKKEAEAEEGEGDAKEKEKETETDEAKENEEGAVQKEGEKDGLWFITEVDVKVRQKQREQEQDEEQDEGGDDAGKQLTHNTPQRGARLPGARYDDGPADEAPAGAAGGGGDKPPAAETAADEGYEDMMLLREMSLPPAVQPKRPGEHPWFHVPGGTRFRVPRYPTRDNPSLFLYPPRLQPLRTAKEREDELIRRLQAAAAAVAGGGGGAGFEEDAPDLGRRHSWAASPLEDAPAPGGGQIEGDLLGHVEKCFDSRVRTTTDETGQPTKVTEYYVKWVLAKGGPPKYVWLEAEDMLPEERGLFEGKSLAGDESAAAGSRTASQRDLPPLGHRRSSKQLPAAEQGGEELTDSVEGPPSDGAGSGDGAESPLPAISHTPNSWKNEQPT